MYKYLTSGMEDEDTLQMSDTGDFLLKKCFPINSLLLSGPSYYFMDDASAYLKSRPDLIYAKIPLAAFYGFMIYLDGGILYEGFL